MATQLTFNLTTDRGQDISVMSQIIAKRRSEFGETSNQSCVAMTINILKSLRADTKQANENEKPKLSIKDVSDEYYPSFQKVGKNCKRVLRTGANGHIVTPKKVKWICSKYHKGQIVHSYLVVDNISDTKKIEYILVADNQKQAEETAKKRHKNRIKQYKNLAKFSLGLAMKKVHDKQQNPSEDINDNAKSIGMNNTFADIRESGYDSGTVNVHVEDNLRYATDALKTTEIEISIQKAMNKMIGYINHKLHGKGIYDDLKLPVWEVNQ